MQSFGDMIEKDHLNMLTNKEFGTQCVNTSNSQTFDIIKTNAFIEITSEGLPIIEDKPMFNTSLKHLDENGDLIDTVIKQNDSLVIESITYFVRDIRLDGIGGMDIYLKA